MTKNYSRNPSRRCRPRRCPESSLGCRRWLPPVIGGEPLLHGENGCVLRLAIWQADRGVHIRPQLCDHPNAWRWSTTSTLRTPRTCRGVPAAMTPTAVRFLSVQAKGPPGRSATPRGVHHVSEIRPVSTTCLRETPVQPTLTAQSASATSTEAPSGDPVSVVGVHHHIELSSVSLIHPRFLPNRSEPPLLQQLAFAIAQAFRTVAEARRSSCR